MIDEAKTVVTIILVWVLFLIGVLLLAYYRGTDNCTELNAPAFVTSYINGEITGLELP